MMVHFKSASRLLVASSMLHRACSQDGSQSGKLALTDLPDFMTGWADIGDNRVGPSMLEMIEGIKDIDDPQRVRMIANRLKFLSSSVYSHANRMEEKMNQNKELDQCELPIL